jgi:hypothetical protein
LLLCSFELFFDLGELVVAFCDLLLQISLNLFAFINNKCALEMNFSNVFALKLDSDPLFDLAFFLEFLKLENGTSNNFISCGTTVITLEMDAFVEGGDFHIEYLVPLWLEPC